MAGRFSWAAVLKKCGAGERIRTADLLITNQLLYQLSYAGFFDFSRVWYKFSNANPFTCKMPALSTMVYRGALEKQVVERTTRHLYDSELKINIIWSHFFLLQSRLLLPFRCSVTLARFYIGDETGENYGARLVYIFMILI